MRLGRYLLASIVLFLVAACERAPDPVKLAPFPNETQAVPPVQTQVREDGASFQQAIYSLPLPPETVEQRLIALSQRCLNGRAGHVEQRVRGIGISLTQPVPVQYAARVTFVGYIKRFEVLMRPVGDNGGAFSLVISMQIRADGFTGTRLVSTHHSGYRALSDNVANWANAPKEQCPNL